MKYTLIAAIVSILVLVTSFADAQSPNAPAANLKKDTLKAQTVPGPDSHSAAALPDDEFNMFLFAYLIGFLGTVFALTLVGTALLIGLLLVVFGMVSAGIISTGIVVGMRRRSVGSGFKTILIILCGLGGTLTGAAGFWLADRGLHLHWRSMTALLTGAIGGAAGGILIGFIVFYSISVFWKYCRTRLQL